jgi:hypothetical protein
MTLTGLLGHVCAIAPKESAREKTAMNARPRDSEPRILIMKFTPFSAIHKNIMQGTLGFNLMVVHQGNEIINWSDHLSNPR